MPRIQADFSNVKAGNDFVALPPGTYLAQIKEIEAKKTQTQKDALNITLVIVDEKDAELNGRQVFDFITMQKNDGTVNPMALSSIKAYAVAVLGEEAASNPEGIDTDDLKDGTVTIVLAVEQYDSTEIDAEGKPVKKNSNRVKRVLPA